MSLIYDFQLLFPSTAAANIYMSPVASYAVSKPGSKFDRTWPRPPSAPVIGIVRSKAFAEVTGGKVNRGGYGLEVSSVYRLYGPRPPGSLPPRQLLLT